MQRSGVPKSPEGRFKTASERRSALQIHRSSFLRLQPDLDKTADGFGAREILILADDPAVYSARGSGNSVKRIDVGFVAGRPRPLFSVPGIDLLIITMCRKKQAGARLIPRHRL